MGVGHAGTETFYGVGAVKKSQLSVFTASPNNVFDIHDPANGNCLVN